jgi:23S rRNA (cytosine1962-C5)-methyltransferase
MNSLFPILLEDLKSGIISLEDSGAGERLERFGNVLIRRPSSLAIWKPRLATGAWNQADAKYDPKSGWSFKDKTTKDWLLKLGSMTVKLIPQDNGQIGIFPEHISYFDSLSGDLLNISQNKVPRVLNLFAYTGLASVWCSLHKADVTHVELSKRVLSWAKENLELNSEATGPVRFIPEDAVTFLEREERRQSKYDLIIADPPSFSRISKTQTWDLEDVIVPLIKSMLSILNAEGIIYLTSHHQALNVYTLENLLRDEQTSSSNFEIEKRDLILTEKIALRSLSCGSLIIAKKTT